MLHQQQYNRNLAIFLVIIVDRKVLATQTGVNYSLNIFHASHFADDAIKKLQSELNVMQKTFVKSRSIKVRLCLFGSSMREFLGDGIELQNNSIQFKASDGTQERLFFDAIYENESIDRKYSDVVPLLESFALGQNVCVFTHGVTGI